MYFTSGVTDFNKISSADKVNFIGYIYKYPFALMRMEPTRVAYC